jgi:transposase
MLFPQSIEEYVPQEAPVRAYDAFVEALDLDELGIQIEPHKVGCPEYDPKVMLKLLIYGYSYGVRSSRKLERETHYNLSFMWLVGGLQPDHKTIAEFRRMNKSALSRVLRQCARFCIKLDLIEGNTLFVDGSKIRGNASINNTWSKQRCQRHLERIDERIGQILSECDAVDEVEDGQPSLVRLDEELKDAETLKKKVKAIMEELAAQDGKSVNSTDPECTNFHGRQGSHAGYNAQMVVDGKHGLIVSSDVVNENTDCRQFAKQIEAAHATLEKNCQVACADSGYCDLDELEKIDLQDVKVVVPSYRQASGKSASGGFEKRDFRYDGQRDCYICPGGEVLSYRGTEPEKRRKVYRAKRSVCIRCCHFGICTNSRAGRKLTRLLKEELKERLEAQYEQADCQEVYRLRKQKVELVFGHIKRNLQVDGFLLRSLAGVRGEMGLLASCFNIARLITIIGVSGLVANFGS